MNDPRRLVQGCALALVTALVAAACTGGPGAGSATRAPTSATGVETEEPAETAPGTPTPVEPEPSEPGGNPDAPDIGDGRPATITIVLSGTSTDSDGTYEASGPARLCGNALFNLTGSTTAFSFEYPQSSDEQINDVTFGAEDLVPGSSTTDFHLGVNVTTAKGHEPPATVINADEPDSGDTGTAQLSDSNGATTLVANGTNDLGETATLTVTCGPRPG